MTNPILEATPANEPLLSQYADDPDLRSLIAGFAAALPERIAAIRAAMEGLDRPRVQRLAHQLKGAAGGYGFAPISDLARDLESAVRERATDTELARRIEALAALCARVPAPA
jgi:HPt (histidine-containing phosphotransfer) domain-containing protein